MTDTHKKYWTDDPERVEQYVLNQISEAEKKQMDAEIADCEPCKELLRKEMALVAGIRRYGRDDVKARLRKRIGRERTSQFYSYQYIGLTAAVIIIALGIGLYEIWFSDLAAPKQFQRQEIIVQAPTDTTNNRIEDPGLSESSQELSRRTDRITSSPQRREQTTQTEQNEIAEIQNDPAEQISPSVGSVAEADALSSEESSGGNQSSAIWLIGKVVMVSENVSSDISTSSKMQTRDERSKSIAKERRSAIESKNEEITTAFRKAKEDGITFQQRSTKELPIHRSQQRPAVHQEVEILVERSEQGLVVTVFDDSVKESDLANAMLETFANDSLVVTLPTQKIAFHLPAGWNVPSTRRR